MRPLSKYLLFLYCFLFLCSNLYSGNKDSWDAKPTYDIVPDSLNKYDIVNVYYRNKIEIVYNSHLETKYSIHQKTKIYSQKGLEEYYEFYIPNYKLLEKIKARTIKPNGTSIELKRDDIKIITPNSMSGLCKFVVPGTNINDEVEIYISYTEINNFILNDVFLHKNYFTIQSEVEIEYSDNLKTDIKTYNKLITPKASYAKSKKSYTWMLYNLEKIGKNNKIIVYNDIPYVRIALKNVLAKNGVRYPIEYSSWNDFGKELHFNEYVGHRLDYDKNLGTFVTKHLGAESDNLNRKQRFDKLSETINFINDSLNLFYTEDTLELNKKLGDHLKNNQLPAGSIDDLYTILLDMTYFEYYLCLGRNRYLGDIDVEFVSRNQITSVFFAFVFDDKYYYIFPKEKDASFNLGEIPNNLEGSKAIIFPRRGGAAAVTIKTIPYTRQANNSKTINTFARVNTNSNAINEQSKIITTGAWSSIVRNINKNLQKDSISDLDIYKFLFNSSENKIDSLQIEKNEYIPPFVFSLKYNKIETNNITNLSDSLKMIRLSTIISDLFRDSDEDENESSKYPVSFLFSNNIKYYLIFDVDVKMIEEGYENLNFENEFGSFNLQIKQLNPKTIYILAKVVFNKSNLNLIDSSPLFELGNKIKEAKNKNLSFKLLK
jgi:hypothetical protein